MTARNNHPIEKAELLGTPPLPGPWPRDLLADIQQAVQSDGRKVVVLDDDPTGTQTVHGIPVLTHWSVEALTHELRNHHPAFYLLTNTRSMTPADACRLSREIGINLNQAARQTGVSVETISRSDSTLRGHFPAEVEALSDAMGTGDRPCLIIPCFFEGGRFTVNDVHYVAEGDVLVPAAQTAYAADAAFGYRHSNLRRWVEEKTGGRILASQVVSITLEDLRVGGPGRVADMLAGLKPNTACVVNAAAYRDLEVFVLGLLQAEEQGRRYLFRTAASFVRVRCGIAPRSLLQARDLTVANRNGGVFVVGSYVPKTTEQVELLMTATDIAALEIDVALLLGDGRRTRKVERVTESMNRLIGAGRDVLLFTSRHLIKGSSPAGSLDIGRRVSDSLVAVVRGLKHPPRYLVAKGGVTSSDLATKGLGVRRAMILGQVLPGVPVWALGEETRFPGMAYIVFPGNVGEGDALVTIKKRLCRI